MSQCPEAEKITLIYKCTGDLGIFYGHNEVKVIVPFKCIHTIFRFSPRNDILGVIFGFSILSEHGFACILKEPGIKPQPPD